MPQLVSEKFNVAWFKLAEFVHRKEKERALAIYRLLVHSVLDTALTLQLEGDLLLAFKDEKAVELYRRAAVLYEQSGRYLSAALVYEQIGKLTPQTLELAEKLFDLHQRLGYDAKTARYAAQIVRILLEQDEHEKVHAFFDALTIPLPYKAWVHESFVLTFLKKEAYTEQYSVQNHINAALDGYLVDPEHKKVTAFLSNLSVLDTDAYRYAQDLLKT